MSIQEILEAHIQSIRNGRCSCEDRGPKRTGKEHNAHVVEVLEKHMQEREAKALHEILTVLNSEAEDAPPSNFEEDNYEAGYIAGLDFAEKLIENCSDKLRKTDTDGR